MTDAGLVVGQPVVWQNAKVVGRERRTPGITSFFLAPSRPFDFRSGQHVDVRLTAEDGYRAIRSYSIASAPAAGSALELAMDRLPDGEVSPFFHDVVVVGDDIEVKGPLGGHFVWDPADGGPILLIGGGSGLAPLMSMVRERARRGSSVPAHLLFSARTRQDVLFGDELAGLAAQDDGFDWTLTLTREADVQPGEFDRRVDAPMVQTAIERLPAGPRQVFICGTNGFVNAAADGAQAAGLPAAAIKTERYGGL